MSEFDIETYLERQVDNNNGAFLKPPSSSIENRWVFFLPFVVIITLSFYINKQLFYSLY